MNIPSKSVNTVVEDIYGLFKGPVDVPQDFLDELGKDLGETFRSAFEQDNQAHARLRVSNVGSKCDKKLWHQVNTPEKAEPLESSTYIKFLIGHLLEHVVIFLAKMAGHEITDAQKEVDLHGIKGHMDCKIDGHLVDVKSAATNSFSKFTAGLNKLQDDFGYIDQLQSYMEAEGVDSGSFLAIDKQHGRLHLDTHSKDKVSRKKLIERKKEMLNEPVPPPRAFVPEPHQKSGNQKIPNYCGYCEHKWHCWPGLRGFAYKGAPVYLTKVVKLPDVPEFGERK